MLHETAFVRSRLRRESGFSIGNQVEPCRFQMSTVTVYRRSPGRNEMPPGRLLLQARGLAGKAFRGRNQWKRCPSLRMRVKFALRTIRTIALRHASGCMRLHRPPIQSCSRIIRSVNFMTSPLSPRWRSGKTRHKLVMSGQPGASKTETKTSGRKL